MYNFNEIPLLQRLLIMLFLESWPLVHRCTGASFHFLHRSPRTGGERGREREENVPWGSQFFLLFISLDDRQHQWRPLNRKPVTVSDKGVKLRCISHWAISALGLISLYLHCEMDFHGNNGDDVNGMWDVFRVVGSMNDPIQMISPESEWFGILFFFLWFSI